MPSTTGLFTSMNNGSFDPPASLASGDVIAFDPAAELELSNIRFTNGNRSLRYKSIVDTGSYYNSGSLANRRVLPLLAIRSGATLDSLGLVRFSVSFNKFISNFFPTNGYNLYDYRLHIRTSRIPLPTCVINSILDGTSFSNNAWSANTVDTLDDGLNWSDVYINFYLSYPSTNPDELPDEYDKDASDNFELFLDKFAMAGITDNEPDPDPPAELIVTYTKQNVSSYGGNNGSINLIPSGGTAPYTFLWDNGSTSQNRTNLVAGVYTVTVHDSAGQTKTLTISIKEPPYDKAWWTRNDITFAVNAPAGWNALTNPRMYNDVRMEDITDSNVFNSKMKIDLPVRSDGTVLFQVREAFRNQLKAEPPALNTNVITRVTDRVKLFKHFTGIIKEVETETGDLTASKPHLIMMGGLSKFAYASIDFFVGYLPAKKKFLTWAPVEKAIDRNQEDYLNWFVFDLETVTLKVSIKAFYDDGTNVEQVTLTKEDVFCGELYVIPAGTSNSGVLGISPAKNLIRYELKLLDQDNATISEVRTFIIDAISYKKRLIMLLNSLGSYEVLRFTGASEYSTDVNKDEIVKFLPIGYAPTYGEYEVNHATLRDTTNISTGFIEGNYGKEWLEYLKELLISRRVFDVTNGVRKPVTIQGAGFDLGADQNYERFLRIIANDSYEDENFTPSVI